MPFTQAGQELLDRLIAESEAFCAKYRKIDPPKDEHEAQIKREIEIFRLRSPEEQNAILDLNNDSIGRAA